MNPNRNYLINCVFGCGYFNWKCRIFFFPEKMNFVMRYIENERIGVKWTEEFFRSLSPWRWKKCQLSQRKRSFLWRRWVKGNRWSRVWAEREAIVKTLERIQNSSKYLDYVTDRFRVEVMRMEIREMFKWPISTKWGD